MSGDGILKVALVALNATGYQSLALGYIRAFAQADPRLQGKVGFTTLDLTADLDPWWLAYRLAQLKPDVVGISVMCWNRCLVCDLCSILRKALPGVRIVLGGPEVGPIAEDALARNSALDVIVRGEGEETFADLLHAYVKGTPVWRVDGLTCRREGEIVSSPDRGLLSRLDDVPSPYLAGVMQPVDGTAYIETFRGCPHSCGYCFEGKGYGRIRYFSNERVEAEIESLFSAGVRTFSFIDPVFNLTRDRLVWLSGVLAPYVSRGLRLHTVEVDVEHIDSTAAKLLRVAGVVSVETGPQSVGAEALRICKRGFDRERFASGVEALKEEGIAVECDLIVGLPGDRASDVLDGIRFIVGVDPGIMQMSTLHVLPGTDLWNRANELGLETMNELSHEIVCTREIGFTDLRRLEALGSVVTGVYRARLESKN